MLLLAEIALSVLDLAIKLGDATARLLNCLDRDEKLPPFLRDEARPMQIRGRPRKLS